jgi:hypothetical protein
MGFPCCSPISSRGFRLEEFHPCPVEQVDGAVLRQHTPHSLVLPHVAGEWNRYGGHLVDAEFPAAHDGASLVYARNQALARAHVEKKPDASGTAPRHDVYVGRRPPARLLCPLRHGPKRARRVPPIPRPGGPAEQLGGVPGGPQTAPKPAGLCKSALGGPGEGPTEMETVRKARSVLKEPDSLPHLSAAGNGTLQTCVSNRTGLPDFNQG